MKKLIAKFKQLISFFTGLYKIHRFKKINKTLEKKVSDMEVDKIILKGEILRMTRKYLQIDAKSKYIPRDYKNNTEIIERVEAEFGERMKNLNVRINQSLELI